MVALIASGRQSPVHPRICIECFEICTGQRLGKKSKVQSWAPFVLIQMSVDLCGGWIDSCKLVITQSGSIYLVIICLCGCWQNLSER